VYIRESLKWRYSHLITSSMPAYLVELISLIRPIQPNAARKKAPSSFRQLRHFPGLQTTQTTPDAECLLSSFFAVPVHHLNVFSDDRQPFIRQHKSQCTT